MTRITTPFGRESTAAEVVQGIDLTGRRMIVTGAASGIGVETARALAGAGAAVTLAVRNLDAGEATAREITATTGNGAVDVRFLDLADRASIAAFAEAWDEPLHVLVNNAGVMASPEAHSEEGWELQFATNHLGHLALALGLHGALAAAGDARIVAVSSSAHRLSPVVFDDIHFERRAYEPWSAYGQSKTANALFALEATRRFADDGITANSLMPGGIRTNLQRYVEHDAATIERWERLEREGTFIWKTTEQGAATSVLLATSPALAGIGGRYFEDCNEAVVDDSDAGSRGVRSWALDAEAATRLWDASLAMLATPVAAAR
ncbi:MAG TPA: SDR family NAD(P)-dependent oxidoreductase [Gaiellales bacterium]|jgi:NAD(P)-dependent dehydrogenase (short-subunit alcohol dehydrogenase family)